MNRIVAVLCIACVCLLGCGAVVLASDDDVSFVLAGANGTIQWDDGIILAKGTGVPPAGALSMPQAQAMAVRAATLEARRNLLDTVRNIQISGSERASEILDRTPAMMKQVSGLIQNSKIAGRKVFPDGSVDVYVTLAFGDGVLEQLLPAALPFTPAEPAAREAHDNEAAGLRVTGVIIDARGTGVTPAVLPRVLSSDGRIVYSLKQTMRGNVFSHGLALYAASPDAEQVQSMVGGSPLVVKAVGLAENSVTDIVVDEASASFLASASGRLALAQCRVAVIFDPVN
ncbi:hypothetical protein [Oleidesulfovibrio sp.]|uniref:hypothetical protein n=1 Tax=Oleidesulfovibrio sp. TaxID=2909707 RepID=UPI003A840E88